MAAPAFNYQTAYNQLGAAYDPQTKQINSEIGQLQPQQDAQMAALDQAKVNAFRDITNSSNARGVLFSGVPIDEQAQYVGTKYLPAVAGLKQTFQNSRNSLTQQLNALNAERVKTAQSNVSAYQKAVADAQYKQAELALRAQANQIAASRAYGGGGGLTAYQQLQYGQRQATTNALHSTVNKITQNLSRVTGNLGGTARGDNYVSPDSYLSAQRDWVQAGYSLKDFNNYFGTFKNPNNRAYNI